MSLLRRFSSHLYALAPKRMQYIITEGKRRLRRLTVEPRLICEAQQRNDELKKKLCGKETINVVFLAVYDSMWKYDALFAAMLRHPRVRLQNRQARVQISPPIMKVAVPLLQHSPILGHLPLVQIVCRQCPSTMLLVSVNFSFPPRRIFNHSGFLTCCAIVFSTKSY